MLYLVGRKIKNHSCIKIKKRFFIKINNGKYYCSIKNKSFFDSTKEVLDEQGKVKYYTNIVADNSKSNGTKLEKKYVIFNNQSKIAIVYAEKKINKNKQNMFLWFTKISKLYVCFSDKTFVISRLENNNFVIKQGENIISIISPYTIIKPQTITVYKNIDIYLLAAIYCLLQYVIYEENMYII